MRAGFVAPDQSVRRAALDATASFIVQAPAGSGKTELLIQRYLALLASVSQPESVLAVTFTRKAAGEMRDRVLAALDSAARGEAPRDPNHALTLQLAFNASEADARHRWRLRSHPARLRIQTIDALAAQITSRMPWLSRFGAQPAVVEDSSELYAEAARRTLDLIEEASPLGESVAHVALHLDNDLRRLRRMIEHLLARRDQWLRYIGSGQTGPDLRATLEQTLALAIAPKLEALRNAIPPEARNRLVECFNFAAQRRDWSTWPSLPTADPQQVDAWKNCAKMLLTDRGAWRSSVTERDGFPAGTPEKGAIQALLGRFQSEPALLAAFLDIVDLPPAQIPDRQWEALEALFQLLPTAAANLKLVFLDRRQVDFVEVADAARRALGDVHNPSDLALYLGDRYEHLLLDEAQDTSLSQLELVKLLLAGWEPTEDRTLFVVGDPMQSIYRFREADVGLFLKLRREGVHDLTLEPLGLTANFRTRPEITSWVNAAFAKVFPPQEDIIGGAVPYHESQATRDPSANAGVSIHPFFDVDMDVEAEVVADLAASCSGRTAILVRARTHAVAIVDVLKRRGIRFRAVDLDPLGGRPVVNDLMALTRALLHPADRTAWLSILRAPWCGLTLPELHALVAPQPTVAIWDLVESDPNPRTARLRHAMAYGLARVRRQPLRQVVEQTWLQLNGPACLEDEAAADDARSFFRLLERHEAGGQLDDITMLEDHAAHLYAKPDPEAGDALEIMTIHKAKGLEWDTVIVPGLGRGPGRDSRPLLRWAELQTSAGNRLVVAPIEATDDDKDPLYEYLRLIDRDKTRYESGRLLYVAATRARERLHLLGHVRENKDRTALLNPFPGSLLDLLWPVVQADYQKAYTTNKPAGNSQLSLGFKDLPQTIRRLARIEPAPLPEASIQPPPAVTQPQETDESDRIVGLIVHGFLDRMARTGKLTVSPEAIQAVAESHATPAADIATRVEQLLRQITTSDRGRWILRPRPESQAEYALGTLAEKHIIDRTFIDGDTRWIIDYKTGKGDGYRDQLNRYGRLFASLDPLPIRLGAYFPQTGHWEEWPLEATATQAP